MASDGIQVAQPVLDGNEMKYVADCIESTWVSSRGAYIERFEAMMAAFCGVRHAVATNNGTTALHLALAALGIGDKDEVIVPSLTYVASVNAIRYCGGRPVFVDSLYPSMTIDVDAVAARITSRTKAVVSVPLYGMPVDIQPLEQLCDRYGLPLVEDAAEALGARYAGRPIGAWGTCATFSFFGNKIITTGEGGMIVTDDPSLADRMRFLRGQAVASDRPYWHTDVGFNYRMTNIAAALGCAQMEKIEVHLQRRQEVAHWYREGLALLESWIQLPRASPDRQHCYWMYTVLLRDQHASQRDHVMSLLAQAGIETRPVFYPVHQMPPYRSLATDEQLPMAIRCSQSGISLPTHGRLTRQDVHRVCTTLGSILHSLPQSSESTTPRKAA